MSDNRNELQKSRMDPGTLDCDCGNRITLIPHRDYEGEAWAGCNTRNLCESCPLNDSHNLISKVMEIFGA